MKLVGAQFKVGGKDAGEVRLAPSGKVTIAVKNTLVQRELENGVLGPKKKLVKAAEGLKFIQAVIRQYSGAYVQAVGIIE
jgi:hypothetical protein